MLRSAALLALALASLPLAANAQACNSQFYRWDAKIDGSLAIDTAHRTSIGTILGRWSLPEFTGQDVYKCAPRTQLHEETVYSLLGWVQRVKKDENDGDWHIELTARQESNDSDCIVVEIPDPQYGAQYSATRADLDSLLASSTINSSGDVTPPVRLRFIGPAFYDGYHRGADRTQAHGHGRCNSSARALWELHPVYWVVKP